MVEMYHSNLPIETYGVDEVPGQERVGTKAICYFFLILTK